MELLVPGEAVDFTIAEALGGVWPWVNFQPDEPNMACNCCGEIYIDTDSMDMLQSARNIYGQPLRLTSGHRCPIHNAEVGGAPLSQHKRIAFDINLHGQDRHGVLKACRLAGFTSFGFYQTFLHTDKRAGRHWYAGDVSRRMWGAS